MNILDMVAEGISPHARVDGVNLIAQRSGGGMVMLVGSSRNDTLTYGTDETHQLIVADVIVVPRLVLASNHLRGAGANGLVTQGLSDQDGWRQHGRLVVGIEDRPGRDRLSAELQNRFFR